MNDYQLLNSKINLFLTKIFEPEENVLQLEITVGEAAKQSENLAIQGVDLGPIQPITYHEYSETFHVRFEEYIAYSVINTSVENLGSGDDEGKSIRIYKQSNFLEYVKAHTLASELYPNNFTHYAFNTLRHIIHVVTTVVPIVEKVR